MIANYPKAYKEVLEVLKYLTRESVNKIPKEILSTFEQFKDNNYEFEIKDNYDLTSPKLMDETKAIFVNLYRDYWATETEKLRIIKLQKNLIMEMEREKCQKYNWKNIFKNKNI